MRSIIAIADLLVPPLLPHARDAPAPASRLARSGPGHPAARRNPLLRTCRGVRLPGVRDLERAVELAAGLSTTAT